MKGSNLLKGKGMKTQILSMVVASVVLSGCATVNTPKADLSKKVNQQDLIKETALHDAVRAKNMEQVKLLLDNKADVNVKDSFGYTPLHLAVRLNQFAIAEYLIQNSAEVNTTDNYQDTPLVDSTRDDYTDLSKLLLCNGANTEVKDRYSMSPLHYSSKNSNKLISEMIIADDVTPFCKVQETQVEEQVVQEELPALEEPKEQVTLSEDTNNEVPLAQDENFKGLYEALNEEFQNDFEPWQAELTQDDLLFRFNNPAAIFNLGDSKLKQGFTDILTDFFPRYLKVINQYKENIAEVRIEGHTSSEYRKAKNDEQRYDFNKKLSEKRASTVREYAVKSSLENSELDSAWVESTFKSYGMSYDDLIFNPDGSENKTASRRVDFKIVKKEQ